MRKMGATYYRVLGKKGRVTIPHALRNKLQFQENDIVSFKLEEGRIVIAKILSQDRRMEAQMLEAYLDTLTQKEQYQAIVYLMASWAKEIEKKKNDGELYGEKTERKNK